MPTMSDADHGNTLLCDREQVVTSRRPLPIRQVRLAMSSSTNSLEDRNASSILGASIWNHEKAIRHVEGVPKWGIGGDLGEASDSNTRRHSTDRQEISNQFKDANNDYRALLNRRAYPTLSYPARSSSENTSGRLQLPTLDKKSELESAVLFDCLANNVLFAHLQTEEVEALISHFEKVQARKNELIIQHGDSSDYFYMVYQGDVKIVSKDGTDIAQNSEEKYTVFGELELLTNSPHLATVKAVSTTCTLFRLHRIDYQRVILQPPSTPSGFAKRIQILQKAIPAEVWKCLEDDKIVLKKLASNMSTRRFQKGDVLCRKETMLTSLVIITEGLVKATGITLGGRSYEDMAFGPNESSTGFGWQSMLSSGADSEKREQARMAGTIVASTDGTALVLSREAFVNILGRDRDSLENLAAARLARIQLQQIAIFKDSALDNTQIDG